MIGDYDRLTSSTSTGHGQRTVSQQLHRERILDIADLTAMPKGRTSRSKLMPTQEAANGRVSGGIIMQSVTQNRRPTHFQRRAAWVSGILVVLVVLVVGIFAAFYLTGGFGSRSLEERFTNGAGPDINAHLATDELCGEKQCISGWKTDVGDFLEFKDEGSAEYWQTILGDASRLDQNIVLDMSEYDNTTAEKKLAIDRLFINKDWQ